MYLSATDSLTSVYYQSFRTSVGLDMTGVKYLLLVGWMLSIPGGAIAGFSWKTRHQYRKWKSIQEDTKSPCLSSACMHAHIHLKKKNKKTNTYCCIPVSISAYCRININIWGTFDVVNAHMCYAIFHIENHFIYSWELR